MLFWLSYQSPRAHWNVQLLETPKVEPYDSALLGTVLVHVAHVSAPVIRETPGAAPSHMSRPYLLYAQLISSVTHAMQAMPVLSCGDVSKPL